MLKYVDTAVTLREIPDEITLCINISNCPCRCKGCHSSYLAGDIGEDLDEDSLVDMMLSNKGITCVAFMGGDSSPEYVNWLAGIIRSMYTSELDKGSWVDVRIAWYSGRQELSPAIELKNFNYIKLGPYIEELGPLNNPNTNQRFYEVRMSREIDENGNPIYGLTDITDIFWK